MTVAQRVQPLLVTVGATGEHAETSASIWISGDHRFAQAFEATEAGARDRESRPSLVLAFECAIPP